MRLLYVHRNISVLLEEEKGDIGGAIQAEEGYIRAGNPEGDGEQRLQHLQRLRAVSTAELETATEALAQTAMADLLQEEEEGGGVGGVGGVGGGGGKQRAGKKGKGKKKKRK